ncbi:MAG TPA: HD domain-containing protein [Candidatus Limnocylindrales bacterium]|nr:HD domain-containing protein [Candidatus Limnocylindrales bacterium]
MTAPVEASARLEAVVPAGVRALVETLHAGGHAAFVVGGCTRDALLGREPEDWDLATDALPERTLELLPGAVYENAFGTVAVRRGDDVFEITTFRLEHEYADFRRPHRLEFGNDIVADLARRDFTVNAIAWGRGRNDAEGSWTLVDPFEGLADLRARLLRAVGDPEARFREDALRMVRAVRLAAALEFEVEGATLAAIRANAALVAHLSGERIGAELGKLLAAPAPSIGLRLAEETGLLAALSPELAAQRGIPQNKVDGEDLWDHTLRAVDAAPAARPIVRLAALLHDIGKPATLADGHFHHHDVVGARQAAELLHRLRFPRAAAEEVVHLVRHHMFTVDPDATDAAVRRFIKRIGPDRVDALFALRRADDVGSGLPPDDPGLAAFRSRIDAELAAEAALDRYALKVDGTDLMRELGLQPGPRLGRIIEELVERVIADPALNEAPTLLLLAQGMLADMHDADATR